MSGRNKKVRVWGRLRPTTNFAHENIEILSDNKGINLHMRRDPKKGVVNNQILDWSFKLDGLFNNANQEVIYNTVATDIVTGSLDGYNGTLMCYGQTGAGKTFTMTGATESYQHRGLIPRAISQLFKQIEDRLEYSITVRVSYMEIYNESMFDLLGSLPEPGWNSKDGNMTLDPMVISENQGGVYVKGLSCHLAQNEEEALNLLFEGETNRTIAAHQLNKQSSRSHCIFTVYLETRSRVQSNAKYTVSKLNFVDLAGSERIGKTKSDGKTKEEAMYINKSLSFLEQVVIALASKSRDHVPFRQSKLTHFLKDSIGGKCNTLLIANMWAERHQLEETVSTLRFATRMMCVASEPAVNEIYDPTLLVKKLQKEIVHLKSELAMHDTLTNRSMVSYDPLSEQQKYEIRTQVRRYLEGGLDEIDVINLRQIVGTFETFKELYVDMEKEMEAKLREKFMLIDKTDAASIAAAQQAGMPIADDGSLVGDLEGGQYGVGMAPKTSKADPSAVVQLKKKERERDRKRGSRGASSPIAGKSASSPSQSAKGDRKAESPPSPAGERPEKLEKEPDGSASPVSSTGNLSRVDKAQRPSTPPTRSAAFEEFKTDRGSEINRILIENKEFLANKKKIYSELANQINAIKHKIDTTRNRLDELKNQREADGPILNEDGDIIISEEEFQEITNLREMKVAYRTKREELVNTESEVKYCQKLVDQCRLKLIQEFDNWYSESFLSSAEDGQSSLGVGHGIRPGVVVPITSLATEDEQEKFERLQLELMMNNPESAAFFNAQMRTSRRKIYGNALGQPQPAYRRQPGTPTMSIRNQPPGRLQVQY